MVIFEDKGSDSSYFRPLVTAPKKTFMQTITDTQERKQLAIGIVSAIGVLGLFSFTMTVFAWERDEIVYFLVLDIALLITIILIFVNVRLAFFLTVLFGLYSAMYLNYEMGNLFVLGSHKNILRLALALPYFTFLILIPLATSYLTATSKHQKFFVTAAAIIAIGFPIFSIAERYNMDYIDHVFINAKINEQGQVILNCKPDFADTVTFVLTITSAEIIDQIKKYAEYYQGSYFLYNTTIKKSFRFGKLKSITITQFNNNNIIHGPTWETSKIQGNISFLQP